MAANKRSKLLIPNSTADCSLYWELGVLNCLPMLRKCYGKHIVNTEDSVIHASNEKTLFDHGDVIFHRFQKHNGKKSSLASDRTF